ncbi:MAG: cobalamin-dependent protein [Armatimonadetes bacterium]|nr:cobalamin-dependent protein [Armatimonadota bacterium]
MDERYAQLRAVILGLDVSGSESQAKRILAEGGDARDVIDRLIKPTADEIGDKFDRGEFFLPHLMLAGNALESAMNVLLAALPVGEGMVQHSVVVGTVKGDIHTIGKNIVAMMLRTGGFTVHDLGVDIDAQTFVREAIAHSADIIALSSLLTTTLPYQKDVIQELKTQGVRDKFKVIIGGGPATPEWAQEIEADAYGKDAAEALVEAKRLVGLGGV